MDDLMKICENIPVRIKAAKDEESKLRNEIEHLRKQLHRAEETANAQNTREEDKEKIRRLEKELERERKWNRTNGKHGVDALELTKTELKETKDELRRTKSEISDYRDRLSKIIGSKITDENPNITDLSDTNRPTKLAERFNLLYDNQWTDAFETLQGESGKDEKQIIKELMFILFYALEFCRKEASKQMTDLLKVVAKENCALDQLSHVERKQLKELRKTFGTRVAKTLYQTYLEELRMSNEPRGKETLKVTPYVKECLEICWLMTIQDPPLEFGPVQKGGDAFDPEAYRAYTRSGPVVDFLVWPAIYLCKGGPVLCKGIAQGTGDKRKTAAGREGSSKTGVSYHDRESYEEKKEVGIHYSKYHVDEHSKPRSDLEMTNATRKHDTEYDAAETSSFRHSNKTHLHLDSHNGSETGLEHPESSYGRYRRKEDGAEYYKYLQGSTHHRPSSSYQQTTMNTRAMVGSTYSGTRYGRTLSKHRSRTQAWS